MGIVWADDKDVWVIQNKSVYRVVICYTCWSFNVIRGMLGIDVTGVENESLRSASHSSGWLW